MPKTENEIDEQITEFQRLQVAANEARDRTLYLEYHNRIAGLQREREALANPPLDQKRIAAILGSEIVENPEPGSRAAMYMGMAGAAGLLRPKTALKVDGKTVAEIDGPPELVQFAIDNIRANLPDLSIPPEMVDSFPSPDVRRLGLVGRVAHRAETSAPGPVRMLNTIREILADGVGPEELVRRANDEGISIHPKQAELFVWNDKVLRGLGYAWEVRDPVATEPLPAAVVGKLIQFYGLMVDYIWTLPEAVAEGDVQHWPYFADKVLPALRAIIGEVESIPDV